MSGGQPESRDGAPVTALPLSWLLLTIAVGFGLFFPAPLNLIAGLFFLAMAGGAAWIDR